MGQGGSKAVNRAGGAVRAFKEVPAEAAGSAREEAGKMMNEAKERVMPADAHVPAPPVAPPNSNLQRVQASAPPTQPPPKPSHSRRAPAGYSEDKNESLSAAVASFTIKDRVLHQTDGALYGDRTGPVSAPKRGGAVASKRVQEVDEPVAGRLTDAQFAEMYSLHYSQSKLWPAEKLAQKFNVAEKDVAILLKNYGWPVKVGMSGDMPVMDIPRKKEAVN